MMKQFLKLFAMMFAVGCHGQQDSTADQLSLRVQELEKTVEKLMLIIDELQTVQTTPTTVVSASVEKRGFMYPSLSLYPNNGFTVDRSAPGDEVGFHVMLSNNANLAAGQQIPFDTIVENIGGAYHMDTAKFICPVSGTYLISLNLACQKGSYVEVSVEVRSGAGSKNILYTVCDHRGRTVSNSGSLYCGKTQNGGTTIVSLTHGDEVYVKKYWPNFGVSIIAGGGLSTFSGYLLRPS